MNQIVEKPTLESLITSPDFVSMLKNLAAKTLRISDRFTDEHPLVSKPDLISEGVTAACNVYKNFDPAKGKWTSYTFMYVLNAMQTFAKRNCHQLSISEKEARNHLCDMTKIGVVRIHREDRARHGGETFDIPVGSGVEIDQNEVDEFYFRGFSQMEVEIFKEHVFEDKTFQQISNERNLSKSSIYLIIERLSRRMKERIQEHEENHTD